MALFASLCIILILCIQIGVYSSELDRIKQSESSKSKEVEETKNRMAGMGAELAELVKSRLPGLKELAFDKVIPVDRRYVKNIVFTLTGKNSQKRFEYKTVLENTTPVAIEPQIQVIFFDRLGIQVGQAAIENVLPDGKQNPLEPGEARSYYNHIQFSQSQSPHYFKVSIENPE